MNSRSLGLLTAKGTPAPTSKPTTERERQRLREDSEFVSVIIKRNDQSRLHPDDLLARAIAEGLEQLNRPAFSLFLSSIAAGLILGFSAMAVAVVGQALGQSIEPLMKRIAVALVYPLGFIICIMSGNQLFTEHTATAVYPILDKKNSFGRLLRLWSIVISGNLSGTLLSSLLIYSARAVINANEEYLVIVDHLIKFDWISLMSSGILAGWLMAQGGWITLAAPPQSSQIICIFLVTFLIGIGGLHHSIAGSAEIFTALLIGNSHTIGEGLTFIALALISNLIGGSVFVAILNYAHIKYTQNRKMIVDDCRPLS